MNLNKDINHLYRIYNQDYIVNSLKIKLPIVYIIVGYFMFSDLYFRNNIEAFYTRLLPILLAISLTVIHSIKYTSEKSKVNLYNLLISSLLIMMYGKCYVHLNDYLNSSITGTVLVLFLISLELRVCLLGTICIYLIPTVLFLIALFSFANPLKEQLIEMTNIIPIIIFGFIANQIQNKYRFKSFEKQHLLELEQNKVKDLYSKSLNQNKILLEQKEAIEQQSKDLVESKSKLEITNNAKDKFISIISHDLKNPFNVIIGFSDLLIHSIENSEIEEIKKYTNIINSSAKQTYTLFENLLNWALLQNNKNHLSFNKTEINKVLEETINLLEPNFIAKNIQLNYTCKDHYYPEIDDMAMATVLRNLITNAIKYTHTGGTIDLDLTSNSDNIFITIKDNGVGMNIQTMKQLFQINSNIQTKGTANETGTGLGLILSYEIIKKHKGEIDVHSNLNQGSTFTLQVPIYQ